MTFDDYCAYLKANYPPRHPHLFAMREEIFSPSFARAVRDGSPAALRSICEEPRPGVYTFDMLAPAFRSELLEELNHFEKWMAENEIEVVRPNTMNNYGAVLDTFGFAPFLQQLMKGHVSPFSSLFYPEVGGATLDHHHGFIVEYAIGKDTELGFHVDASDVTLNVCLGREFTAGELFFHGLRCGLCQQTEPLPGESFTIKHVPGRAILHRGNHRHGAHPITSGSRYNLILWCFSSEFDGRRSREHSPQWCGWPDPATAPRE